MRFAWSLLAILAGGVLATELVMRPTWAERRVLISLYLGAILATALASLAIRWLVPRARSIRLAVFVVSTAAVSVAAVAVGLSSGFMFSSMHDLRLLAIALSLGVALALALSMALARQVTSDLERLAEAARRVGEGERMLNIGVDRADEIGVVAGAMAMMVERLQQAEDEADAASAARRQFLASVSHDLRTPLASLTAAVEALEDGVASDETSVLSRHGERPVAAGRPGGQSVPDDPPRGGRCHARPRADRSCGGGRRSGRGDDTIGGEVQCSPGARCKRSGVHVRRSASSQPRHPESH